MTSSTDPTNDAPTDRPADAPDEPSAGQPPDGASVDGKSGDGAAKRAPAFAFEPEEIFVYQPLLDQLKDDSPARRESACWILGELRYKSANKAISRLLTQDKNAFVRLGAARALERIGDSWSVQAIIRGLKDEDPLVRQVCIAALGKLQDKQAIYPLEQLIKYETDEDVKVCAETALRQIAGKPHKTSSPWERKVFKYLRQIELEPDNANAHHNLAVSYFHANRYQEARKYCVRARQLGANVDWLEGKLRDLEAQEQAAAAQGGDGDDVDRSSDAIPVSDDMTAPLDEDTEGGDDAEGSPPVDGS